MSVAEACVAVTHAMRPRMFDTLAHLVTWPTPDANEDVAFILTERILNRADLARSEGWWDAFGESVSVALEAVTRLDLETARFVVGASLQAHISGGADLSEDSVLRLGERAACWRAGTTHKCT